MKRIISLFLTVAIALSWGVAVSTNNAIASSNQNYLNYNGHTYVMFDLNYKWTEAKEYCEEIGGHLVTITSKEEDTAIYNWLISKGYYTVFLGASCESGVWEWVNGEPFEYQNWHEYEPSGGGEKYLEYYSAFTGGTWNDTTNNSAPFVCEFDSNIEIEDTPFKMVGSANYNPITHTYQLTSLKTYDFGCIWLNKDIDSNFKISFEYKAGGGTNQYAGGADGFVFMFYANKNFTQEEGEELGFVGCNGYGVEFDSFYNSNRNDSEKPHIALIKDDTSNHIISVDNNTVEDNQWHTAVISVKNSKIQVNIDEKNIFEWTGDFVKGGGDFGFSATTGDGINNHFIRNIQINDNSKNTDVNIKTNSDPSYMPIDINMVTINGQGTAYGRFKILSQDGTPAKNKKVYYSIDDGMERSVTTDSYGYAIIKIEGITESKNYNITFSGKEIGTTEGILIVTVEPLHFKSGLESSIEKGASVGLGFDVGAEVDFGFANLKAKAGVASIGAEGSGENSFSFEQEYANNKHKITLSSKTNYTAAVQAKVGLFADIKSEDVAGVEVDLAEANGKAGYSRFVGASYEDDDFKFSDSQDVWDLSMFMLSALIGTQQGNVATEYIAKALDAPTNATEMGSVITLEAGASVGAIEASAGNVTSGVTLASGSVNTVWTNSTKTMKDKSHLYSSGITAGDGVKLFDTSIGYSKAKTSLGVESDFINDNLNISATEDENGNLKEVTLSSKQSGEDGSFLYKKTDTTAKQITYKDSAAEGVVNSDNSLKEFTEGNKAYFSKNQMNKTIDNIINSDQSGKYSQTQNTKEALSLDLSASVKLLVKVGGKFGLSGTNFYEYETENGIYENGTAYIQAENDIRDEVEARIISFDDIKEYTKDAINNFLSSIWETVVGVADGVVEFGQAAAKKTKDIVTGWKVSITKGINSIGSIKILAVEDEFSLFSTSSLAITIGEPYIISVEDENGNEVTDFSENPLTLTLSYTEEQLAEAGITDIDGIAVVRWDDDKGVYVKQDGIHDVENSCLTVEIVKPGQYILAVDNCAPAITQFAVSGEGETPDIYAVVSDMSGIQNFAFRIDDTELINNSNLEEYYNSITGEFKYSTKDIEEGKHTAAIYAQDTFGNEIEETLEFTVDKSVPEISDVTVIPQAITDEVIVSANVVNASAKSILLNTEVTDAEDDTYVLTVEMVEEDGKYTAKIPDVKDGCTINVWISAYTESGNGTESEKQQAVIMKSEGEAPVDGVSLNKEATTLTVGETETLTATTSDNEVITAVTWESSDTNVATVLDGVITAKSAGVAIITVTTADGEFTANCTVTVTENTPTITPGDLNSDSTVDVRDVIALRRFIVGGYGISADENVADINKDGGRDVRDVIMLRRFIVGGYGIELK